MLGSDARQKNLGRKKIEDIERIIRESEGYDLLLAMACSLPHCELEAILRLAVVHEAIPDSDRSALSLV